MPAVGLVTVMAAVALGFTAAAPPNPVRRCAEGGRAGRWGLCDAVTAEPVRQLLAELAILWPPISSTRGRAPFHSPRLALT